MKVFENVLDLVGNTPLVKLEKMSRDCPFPIYAKVEYFNPGSSVKDRIAIKIIEEAEKRGDLKPGGTIVEATSGNTGMGLALTAAVKGYKAVFVMPDKMSMEKIQALRAFGARVVVTPTNVEPEDPRSYYCVSKRIAEETPNAFYANQYHNPDNPQAHYETTGPEIWEQTEGKITTFIAGLGTGGTITGVGKYLKEKNPNIKIVGVDPEGSVYADLIRTGKMGEAYPYKVEGVGEDFLPSTIDLKVIDDVVVVSDRESFQTTRKLARREGLFVGGSCGFAVCGAVKWAQKQKSKDEVAVVLLPDSGSRYLSKIFNDDWMRENGFLEESEIQVSDIFQSKRLISAAAESSVNEVIELLKSHDIDQLPVTDKNGKLKGIITSQDLLDTVAKDPDTLTDRVENFIISDVETVSLETNLHQLQKILKKDFVPVVVHDDEVLGVITQIDLLDWFVQRTAKS